MGSVTDFLFNGQTPTSMTTYNQTAQNIPTWLSDATLGLVNKANAIASAPYAMYDQPRIAGFSGDQTAAQGQTRQAANGYQPAVQGALTQTANTMNTVSPYYDAAASNFNTAGQQINGAVAGAQPGYDTANADLGQATAGYSGSVADGKSGLSTAMPWLQGASATYTGNTVDQYMNPYTQNVIDAATLAANRNFKNNIMPQLSDTFTANGQFGSTGHETEANRAAYDLTTGLQTNALGALSQAYNAGQGAFQSDMSRYAGLAGTAGQLGTAEQSAEQAAAAGIANVGQTTGNLANQRAQLGLTGAADLGTLGSNYSTLGTNVAQTDLASANQQANLAQKAQQMDLTGASALAASGADQQALQQKGLDMTYQDFINQRDYAKNQSGYLSDILRGVPYSTSGSQLVTSGGTTPSTASQLASLASGLYGLTGTGKARGGFVNARRYARGGRVRPRYRGALYTLEA